LRDKKEKELKKDGGQKDQLELKVTNGLIVFFAILFERSEIKLRLFERSEIKLRLFERSEIKLRLFERSEIKLRLFSRFSPARFD